MEEYDFFAPLADGYVEVTDAAGHALFEVGEFVVVGREERARAFVAEVFGDGPGEAEAVEGGRAAADFVEDDQGLGGCVVEDGRGLGHLDHEGGLAGVEGVIGADAGEDAVGDANGRGLGWDERAGVGQENDEGGLANEGRLARHVWPSDEREWRDCFGFAASNFGVVGDELLAEDIFENRVAALFDVERGRLGHAGADPGLAEGFVGEAEEGVEFGDLLAEVVDGGDAGGRGLAEGVEEDAFAFEGSGFGGGDFVFEVFELGGDVALGVFEGLLAAEGRGGGLGLGRGELYVVAEDFVVADFDAGELVLFDELFLVLDEPGGGIALEELGLVELGIDTVADEAAVAEVRGRGVDALGGDAFGDGFELAADGGEGGEGGREGWGVLDGGRDEVQAPEGCAEGNQVARGGAAEGDSTGDSCDVLNAVERGGEGFGGLAVFDEDGDTGVSGFDFGEAAEWAAEPLADEALAHGGDGGALAGEEEANEGAVARALFGGGASDGSFDFQGAETDGVEDAVAAAVFAAGWGEVR